MWRKADGGGVTDPRMRGLEPLPSCPADGHLESVPRAILMRARAKPHGSARAYSADACPRAEFASSSAGCRLRRKQDVGSGSRLLVEQLRCSSLRAANRSSAATRAASTRALTSTSWLARSLSLCASGRSCFVRVCDSRRGCAVSSCCSNRAAAAFSCCLRRTRAALC